MSDERPSRDEEPSQNPAAADAPPTPTAAIYAPPTLTVHGPMVVLTAQGTKPGRENQGNVRGSKP